MVELTLSKDGPLELDDIQVGEVYQIYNYDKNPQHGANGVHVKVSKIDTNNREFPVAAVVEDNARKDYPLGYSFTLAVSELRRT